MSDSTPPVLTKIILHKVSRTLEVQFANGENFILPCAYLRAFSTSAEMRGINPSSIHSGINILAIEHVGHYAIKPIFSDGHRTGIYPFNTLYELGKNKALNWTNKLAHPFEKEG